MSKVCQICGKKPSSGHNVSHSVRRTKRKFNPNLIWKRIYNSVKAVFEKKRLCAKCFRSLRKSS